jgi:hypothetical protein
MAEASFQGWRGGLVTFEYKQKDDPTDWRFRDLQAIDN